MSEENGNLPSTDFSVVETSSSRPGLRRDLSFNYQESKGRPHYVLEDLTRRSYFQIGLPEYRFLLSLDGSRTVREALAHNARLMGEEALSESQAQILLRWAVDHELFESDASGQDDRRQEHHISREKEKPKKILQEVLFLKIPLGNPEPLLRAVSPWLAWTVTPLFFIFWIGVLFYSGVQLILHWGPFMAAAGSAVLPANWFYLLITFVVLKLTHELWHGLLARRFQIPVPEWGIRLLAFISPLTYVDASASWRLSSRWPRICVAAGGMYVELFIAAIAVLVWIHTEPGWVNTMAYNAAFAASVVTVLFNANPLLKFDGYYILSDLLQIPNLATKGQRFVMWSAKRYLFGMREEKLPRAILERRYAIGIYGFLAAIWRVVIWIAILAIASYLFKGSGIVIVALILTASIVTSLKRFFRFLLSGSGGVRPNLASAGLRIGGFLVIIGCLLAFVPVSPSPKMAAVIDYPEKAVLRVECPGFVREIFCQNGDRVEAGQPLLRMENPVKSLELEKLRLEMEESALRSRYLLEGGLIASYQAEAENHKGLKQRHAVMETLLDTLEFRATVAGRVFAHRMEYLSERYLKPGDVVMVIVPDESPELLISISQDDLEAFNRRRSDEITFRLRGWSGSFDARLTRADARATTLLPHPALSSSAGGPLIVRQQQTLSSEREQGLVIDQPAAGSGGLSFGREAERERLARQELATSRLLGYAEIEGDDHGFREGEWGFAEMTGGQRYRLGEWIGDGVVGFLKKQFQGPGP